MGDGNADCVLAELARVGASYGVIMHLGVRPNGTWFAYANYQDDLVEWDGSTPAQAIESVRHSLRVLTDRRTQEAKAMLARAQAALAADDEWHQSDAVVERDDSYRVEPLNDPLITAEQRERDAYRPTGS